MKLWLLRHARVLMPSGICYGASDVDADQAQTEQVAQQFADLPASGSRVWVSPAIRTQQLASALLTRRKDLQGPQVDSRLREMDFGVWELQPWADIPAEAMAAWTDDFARHRFGGNECTQDVIDRVAQALDATLAQSVSEAIWVTHAGVIRAVQFLQAGGHRSIHSARDWPVSAPSMGEWMCIEIQAGPPH
jgi:alpha-ribazole phosphatase